jgi:hypothetical protein
LLEFESEPEKSVYTLESSHGSITPILPWKERVSRRDGTGQGFPPAVLLTGEGAAATGFIRGISYKYCTRRRFVPDPVESWGERPDETKNYQYR